MSAILSTAFTLAVSSLTGLASAKCYDLNNITQQYYEPCGSDPAKISMCCALTRPNPYGGRGDKSQTADRCLPNGLCINLRLHVDKNINITEYWRSSCNIETGMGSPSCLRDFCPERNEFGHTPVTPCDGTAESETWCCGKNSTTCCGTPSAIKIPKTFDAAPISLTTASTISSPADSVTKPTSSSSSSPPISVNVPESKGMSTGAIVGCVVAGIAILIAVLVVIAFLFLKKKQKKQDQMYSNNVLPAVSDRPYQVYKHEAPSERSYIPELMSGAQASVMKEKKDFEHKSDAVALPATARYSSRDDKMFELDAFSIPPTKEKNGW